MSFSIGKIELLETEAGIFNSVDIRSLPVLPSGIVILVAVY